MSWENNSLMKGVCFRDIWSYKGHLLMNMGAKGDIETQYYQKNSKVVYAICLASHADMTLISTDVHIWSAQTHRCKL